MSTSLRFSLGPLAISLLLLACNAKVVTGGGGGAGGDGGAGGAGSSAGGASPTGGSGGGGPNAIIYGADPVKLRISNVPLSCSNPQAPNPYDTCDWYNIELTIPLAKLVVGPLDPNDYSAFISETSAPSGSDPTDCGGTAGVTGGSMAGLGDITITEVDANKVSFDIGAGSTLPDHDPAGSYLAPRCSP